MLKLSRRAGESIQIGDDIEVMVLWIRPFGHGWFALASAHQDRPGLSEPNCLRLGSGAQGRRPFDSTPKSITTSASAGAMLAILQPAGGRLWPIRAISAGRVVSRSTPLMRRPSADAASNR
jgi:hypothetical protein